MRSLHLSFENIKNVDTGVFYASVDIDSKHLLQPAIIVLVVDSRIPRVMWRALLTEAAVA